MSTQEALLQEIEKGKARQVYLFHGEEFLAKKAAEEIVHALVAPEQRDLNLSILDGASPAEVARDLATIPMFRGTKVVWLQEPEFLAPKKAGKADQLGRLRELWEQGRKREAARRLLALAQKAGLDPSSATAKEWEAEAGLSPTREDLAFSEEAAAWAKEEGISAPGADAAEFERLLQHGIPEGNHLVISTLSLDARLGLVKKLKELGAELSFKPAGRFEKRDVGALASAFLEPLGKRLAPKAAALLESLVGGDQVRRLHGELEKVALFVGERETIEADDVAQVVERTQEIEFLLTNSLEKRDLAGATEGLSQLLEGGGGLPQAVASIATTLRGLLAARDATQATGGRIPGFGAAAQGWVAAYQASGLRMGNPNAAKFRAEAASRFQSLDLARALLQTAEVDKAIKSGGGRLDVERLLWQICQRTE